MQVIPAVDVLGGTVVRLRRGDFSTAQSFGDDPVARARFWTREGADIVHVVDLEGARSGRFDPELWRSIGAAGVRFQAGGGLRRVADVTRSIEAGADRAVIGTAAIWSPSVLADMIESVGPERIVAAIDVRDGLVAGSGWKERGRPLADVATDLAAVGIVRAIVTGISQDGMLEGPDRDLLEEVADLAPGVALIASGGVATLDDIASLAAGGFEAAIIGRALYDARFTLGEAIRAAS